MIRAAFAAVACFAFVAANAAEPVRVSVGVNPDTGKSVRQSMSMVVDGTAKVHDVQGHLLSTKNLSSRITIDSTQTTVARSGDGATFRIRFDRVLNDMPDRTENDSMAGHTYTLSSKGRDVTVAVDAGPITDDQRRTLTYMMQAALVQESKNLCVSRDALSVGSSWVIPARDLPLCFAPAATLASDRDARATLTAVEQRGTHPVAIIDVTFDRAFSALGPLKFDAPANGRVASHLEVALDDPSRWVRTTTTTFIGATHPAERKDVVAAIEMRAVETVKSRP